MGHTYINGHIVGFKVEATEGAIRNGVAKHRPEVVPRRLLPPTQTLQGGKLLRDLGEKKWQGTKGGEDFHRTFLSIINFLVRQDNKGITLYYEQGHRGTVERKRPPILAFDPLPDTAGERLGVLGEFVDHWRYHYGHAETFSYDQTEPMLNWLATIVSRDPEMRDLLVEA